MPNCLCEIFYVRDAPAAYPDNRNAGPDQASPKIGLKWAGPENFWRKWAGSERQQAGRARLKNFGLCRAVVYTRFLGNVISLVTYMYQNMHLAVL